MLRITLKFNIGTIWMNKSTFKWIIASIIAFWINNSIMGTLLFYVYILRPIFSCYYYVYFGINFRLISYVVMVLD
jgi:hypothetical protein